MTYVVQAKSGSELNRPYEEDLSIHDWYRFILSYPPHLVKDYIQKFSIDQKQSVLDPFCGTGTTLVECKKNGIPSIGIEANPVVQLMAETKVSWNVDGAMLLKHAEAISKETKSRLLKYGNNFKSLTEEQEKIIIKDSISPLPLHKALVLLEVMNDHYDVKFGNHEKTAFAKQLVHSFSNLKFGPEVGVSRKKKTDVDVVDIWLRQVNKMADDLINYKDYKDTDSVAYLSDSRNIGTLLKPCSINAVITSPPYPNEKDYSRTTRLESVLLGFIENRAGLRASKENLLRSNTRNIYVKDTDDIWIAKNARVLELADSIEKRRILLEKNSGFEKLYHKVVKSYFGGMAKHLNELKPNLKPGAKLAYVVGDQASYFRVLIHTGEILAEIAEDLGYKVVGIDLFRTRISTATKDQLREEVVLLEWEG